MPSTPRNVRRNPGSKPQTRSFGRPGSGQHTQGKLRIGHARLPQDLRDVIQDRIEQKAWNVDAVLIH